MSAESELDNYISHLTEDEKDAFFILSVLIFMKIGGKEEWIMDIIEFNKMTEELEEVANKYGLTVDFGSGTIGGETEIILKLHKAVQNEHRADT